MKNFGDSVGRFGKKSLDELGELKQSVAIRLFSAVVADSPVLTGRLRANWQCSIGGADETTTENTDQTGSLAIESIVSTCEKSTLRQSLHLTNSLPYAARIEFDGWSKEKAPAGMVRKNVKRFRQILQAELKKI